MKSFNFPIHKVAIFDTLFPTQLLIPVLKFLPSTTRWYETDSSSTAAEKSEEKKSETTNMEQVKVSSSSPSFVVEAVRRESRMWKVTNYRKSHDCGKGN